MGELSEFATRGLEWIRPYFGAYGIWLVLGLLLLKGVIFVSPFLPGASVLVIAGGLARQGHGSPYLLALSGFAGTAAGDIISYWIGRQLGHRLMRSERWGQAVAHLSVRLRHEPALILFCHFETFLRTFIPATAGMSGVPFRRWLALNAVGSALWAACYTAAGYYLSLSSALMAGRRIALLLLGALLLYLAARYLHKRLTQRRAQASPDPNP